MGKATYTVTVTNNSNGVSVDYETEAPMTLLVPDVAAEVVKDLVNTVRSYDTTTFAAGDPVREACDRDFLTVTLNRTALSRRWAVFFSPDISMYLTTEIN